MADRLNYYFRQRVTEAELDLAFDLLEQADRNLAADIGIHGIIRGAEPSPHAQVPDLSIDLTGPAQAYDHLGQRIFFGTSQRIDCAVDADGLPTEVLQAGEERWLGLFLKFDRQPSEPRTDGNSQQVFFRRDESFRCIVRQAPPGPIGSASKVALLPDALLICDVQRRHGQTQLLAADIDTSRRQSFVFTRGDAVAVIHGAWSTLQPATGTVQASLDEVDSEFTRHFQGTARRHGAHAIDIPARAFISATTMEGAFHELLDDLTSAAPLAPGAQNVGAAAAPGTPHGLTAGNVGGQLFQLLAWLNAHLGAVSSAHHAGSIAATAHAYINSTNVQAQLQEVVGDLSAQTLGAAGASRIGAEAVSGTPSGLAAGTVGSQLAALLAATNGHVTDTSAAHTASAITLADTGGNLAAANVEGALAEILDAFEMDHFRANEPSAGFHRTIRQPTLGGSKALLWHWHGTATSGIHLRVYGDQDSIWFTLNAAWDGSRWERDTIDKSSSGFRLSISKVEFLYDASFSARFLDWTGSWRLGTTSEGIDSNFETAGAARDIGRLGIVITNTSDVTQTVYGGGTVAFRGRFEFPPSSITLALSERSSGFSGLPMISNNLPRIGFSFFSNQEVPARSSVHWYGNYFAVA